MIAALLALAASFVWGTSDFMGGLQSRRSTAWAVVLVCPGVAALGSVAMIAVLSPPAPSRGLALVLVVGGLCSAVSALTYYRAMTLTKMSVVSPILAGAAVVPVLWGLARGEQPHPLQLVGVVAAIAGIVVISRPGPTAAADDLPVTRIGVILSLLSALGAGLMLVTFDYGATTDPFWAVTGVRVSASFWIAVSLAVTRPRLGLQRRAVPLLILIGLMIVSANTLFAAATTFGELSVVAVLGWLSPAVTILCARLVLHERLRPLQWAAAAAVLVGVVFLALG